jgi:hypothetical protein
MNLLNYAFYMHWRQFEMLWLSLASKLGFHPSTKAILVAISTSPPNWPPILVGLCSLYASETL